MAYNHARRLRLKTYKMLYCTSINIYTYITYIELYFIIAPRTVPVQLFGSPNGQFKPTLDSGGGFASEMAVTVHSVFEKCFSKCRKSYGIGCN
jgi:hypothetical protein